MRRDEMVNFSMGDRWFEGLIESLNLVKDNLEQVSEKHPDQGWERNLKENAEIIEKIIRYGEFYEDDSGEKRIRVSLYSSTASDLIWQLLLASMLYVTVPKDSSHYEKFKKLHDDFTKNSKSKI